MDKRNDGGMTAGQIAFRASLNMANKYAPPGHAIYPEADVQALVEALEGLVRNGQKQGWNDRYETDMDKARAALAKFKESGA